MKRQPTVQAFEEVLHNGQMQGFTPPEGTVPVGGSVHPHLAGMSLPEQDAIENPNPASLESLNNGKVYFQRYCATCHGAARCRWCFPSTVP
jgi:mono/diheme cytochrome c family protein